MIYLSDGDRTRTRSVQIKSLVPIPLGDTAIIARSHYEVFHNRTVRSLTALSDLSGV